MAIASRRIVVAVDESEESMYALSWCLKNVVASPATDAAEHGGDERRDTIVLLHARRPRTIYPPMDGTGELARVSHTTPPSSSSSGIFGN